MQGAVVPPGILMFLFILPRLIVQTTLKPVYLPQSPFPEPEGLPYLQLLIPLGGGEPVVDQGLLESWKPKSTGL